MPRKEGPTRALLGDAATRWPERVGNYHLLALLGQGGMGAVFSARHANLNKIVALKLLPPGRLHSARAVNRFYREMSAVGAVEHNNVIRATDAGEADGFHFLVMEYCEGADVKRLLDVHGPIEPPLAAEIVRQAAIGVEAIHAAGLVHRDIKPSNLLLARDGTIKILDLGLARFTGVDPREPELTGTGVALGTPDFIAPEQADGARTVDIRADIYGLGCTLYALLCGHPPFALPEYDSWPKKILAHCQTPIPPLDVAEVSPELNAVVMRCLEKDPARRYQHPRELVAAVTPFCKETTLLPLAERHAKLFLAAPTDAPASTVETQRIGPSSSMRWPVSEAASALRPRRSSRWRLWTSLAALLVLGSLVGMAASGIVRNRFSAALPLGESTPPERVPDGRFHLPMLPAENRPERQNAFDDDFTNAAVHQWNPLLRSRPWRGIWIDEKGLGNVSYDQNLQQLSVNAGRYALVQLGKIEANDYQLQIGIYQNAWGSGSGMFWGLQREPQPPGEDGKVTWKCQYVRFLNAEPDQANLGFRLVRGVARWIQTPGGDIIPGPTEIASHSILHAITGEQILNLRVVRGVLEEITIDQEPAVNLLLANGRFQQVDYHGGFGTFNYESSAVFRNAQIKRLPSRN